MNKHFLTYVPNKHIDVEMAKEVEFLAYTK